MNSVRRRTRSFSRARKNLLRFLRVIVMSDPSNETKTKHETVFATTMIKFATYISETFPDKAPKVQYILSNQKQITDDAFYRGFIRSAWRDMTKDSVEKLAAKDVAELARVVAGSNLDVGMHEILTDGAVDESVKVVVWKYINVLTGLAHAPDVKEPAPSTQVAVAPQAAPQQAPAAPQGTPQGTQQPAAPAAPAAPQQNAAASIAEAVPAAFKALDEMLKNKESPLGEMIRAMMGPQAGALGVSGLMNSMADRERGRYHPDDEDDEMSEALQEAGRLAGGLSPAEIVAKLKRLERAEAKARSKKADKQ